MPAFAAEAFCWTSQTSLSSTVRQRERRDVLPNRRMSYSQESVDLRIGVREYIAA